MSQDILATLLLLLITFLLSVAQSYLSDSITTSAFLLTLLERLLNLGFLYLITFRALTRVGLPKISIREHLSRLGILLAYGTLLWFTVTVPVIAIFINMPVFQKFIFTLLLFPSILFSFRYFFYFFPIILGVRSTTQILRMAFKIGTAQRFTAIKIIISAMGLTSLCIAVALFPAPDGRIPLLVNLADSFQALFWISSSYYAIGFSLRHLEQSSWSALGLDPYREARLETLTLRAPAILNGIFNPRRGFFFLMLSLMIWSFNTVRIASSAPAPNITVMSSITRQQTAQLKLKLVDQDYLFHGFIPMHFAIAGTNRELVCASPKSARLEDLSDSLYSLPHSAPSRELTLEFDCTRNAEELSKLEDLHLWYRQYKVLPLRFAPAPTQNITGQLNHE